MEHRLDEITDALARIYPDNAIYLKRDEHASRAEHLVLKNGYVKGTGSCVETIDENGMKFIVEIERGQKTGFYLDQRENRRMLSMFAQGKSVCNLFSYTGAFSVAAVKGGACRVLSVDSSRLALECALKNAELNFPGSTAFSFECADVFEIVEKLEPFDIMIVDPPPFARKKAELDGAVTGYRHINEHAVRRCAGNGFVFTFSCSHAVSREMFRDIIIDASRRSGRDVRIIGELAADSDHPVSAFHPEGNYLKGLVLHVA